MTGNEDRVFKGRTIRGAAVFLEIDISVKHRYTKTKATVRQRGYRLRSVLWWSGLLLPQEPARRHHRHYQRVRQNCRKVRLRRLG